MRLKRLALPALATLAWSIGCGTAPVERAPSKAVVVSLDGAGAEEFWRLHEEGAFGPDGFERLLREGEAVRRLVPVNPPLTAVNHISLVTGATAAKTGIVSNSFHFTSDPITQRADGFAAPIEAETLWQAAQRQGKRAGVVAWPGAATTADPASPAWALDWTSNVLRRGRILAVAAAEWSEPPAGSEPPPSHAPARVKRVELEGSSSFPAQTLELYALDRRDDQVTAYDAIAVRDAATGAVVTLAAGESRPLVFSAAGFTTPVAQGLELQRLTADGDSRLYLARLYRNIARPAAYERALAGRSVLWPSPPDDDALEESWAGKPGLTLEDWVRQSDRFATFFVDALLTGMQTQDWDLALGYVPTIDEAEHQLLLVEPRQPEWSAERQHDFAAARRKVWLSADREVARLLRTVDGRTTTVHVLSDHGLAPVHTSIDANAVLKTAGLLRTTDDGKVDPAATQAAAFGSGAIAHLYVNLAGREPGGIVPPAEKDEVVRRMREIFGSLRAGEETPIARVLTPDELAALGLANARSGDLVLFAASGYWFSMSKPMASKALFPSPAYGQHGYLNDDPRMHAIYLAWGAGISPRRLDSLSTTQVAARVSARLGIEPPRDAAR
jgi:predicted AlkP superfamily phosphohydrolase/phosphomutase